jgi:DNA polymerase-1
MDDYLRQLFKAPALILDIEIDVPDDAIERDVKFPYPWEGGELVWLGITDGTWYYLMPADEALELPLLKELAAEYTGILAGHNINGDLVSLAADGIEFPKATHHDTMLWYKTMPNPPATSVSLKWLAKQHYGASAYEAPVHTLWDQKTKTSQIPELMVPYLTLDLYYHWKLYEDQRTQTHPSPSFLLAMDYLPVILRTAVNGFAVDIDGLDLKAKELAVAADVAQQKVQDLARGVRDTYLEAARLGIKSKDPKRLEVRKKELEVEFDTSGLNLNSPAQMKAFFQATGLDIDSTNEKVLAEHADHPSAGSLLEFRGIEKEKNTYALDWQRRVLDPRGDGLIHPHYAVSGAETTRLRCSNPNDQNVPGSLRGLRISRYPGGKLINSDLAAIEYRIIAHMSGDARLRQLFLDGIDIHKDAAARVYGIRPEQVTKEQRKVGKTFNFAGVYGAGPEKIFSVIGREDMKLYYKVKNLYPGVPKWKERLLQRLHTDGTVRNCFGQWWQFDGPISAAIEREAINRIVQSAGHTVLVLYRLAVEQEYQTALEDGHLKTLPLMVQEGHDSFVDDSPGSDADQAKDVVDYVAGGLNHLILEAFNEKMTVPILAETKILDRWE